MAFLSQVTHSQVPNYRQVGAKLLKLRKYGGLGACSQLPALKGGERGVLKAPGLNQEEGQAYLVIQSCI